MSPPRLHLLLGGARAGKSRRALLEAEAAFPEGPLGFIATAEPRDEDIADRIHRHQAERSPRWRTIEAPVDLASALRTPEPHAFVVDCLTLWLANVLLSAPDVADADVEAAITTLDDALAHARVPVWVVSNEVGLGIVPGDALSRRYRDLLGRANQRVAARADRVTLMVAGLSVPLKSPPGA